MKGIQIIFIFLIARNSFGSNDPCEEANHLTIPNIGSRYTKYKTDSTEYAFQDSLLPEGWYYVGDFDDNMPETPPDFLSCGARFPIWLNGSHPITQNIKEYENACQVGPDNTCEISYPIAIVKCKDFYVYRLIPTHTPDSRYCFGTKTDCVAAKPKVIADLHVINSTGSSYHSETRFMCQFQEYTELLHYVVTWYQYSALMFQTSSATTWNDSKLHLTESLFMEKEFYMGANILTPSLHFHHDAGVSNRTIRLQATVPIGCKVFSSCKILLAALTQKDCSGIQFQSSGCGVMLDSSAYSDVYEIVIKSNDMTTNYPRDGVYAVHLRTFVNNYNKMWQNYILPTITVNIATKANAVFPGKVCHSYNDPHIRTFDGRYYDNQQNGTYVLYQNTNYSTEVQVRYQKCGTRAGKPIQCNCGVAIKAGRDLYKIDVCDDMQHEYVYCDDKVLEIISVSEFKYKVSFPYGTCVEVNIEPSVRFLNIDIYPSSHDESSLEGGITRGLCGIMDGNCSNDYHYRNNDTADIRTLQNGGCNPDENRNWNDEFQHQPESFIEEWRVKLLEEDMFTRSYNLSNFIPWDIKACICTQESVEKRVGPDFVQNKTTCIPNGMSDCGPGKVVGIHSCQASNRRRRSVGSTLTFPNVKKEEDTTSNYERRIKREPANAKNWTIGEATKFCQDYMSKLPVFDLCGNVPNVRPDNYISTCIADIMLTGGTSWSSMTIEALQNSCLAELQRNTSLREAIDNGPSIAQIIEDQACPNNCSSIGSCSKGQCICDEAFGGSDCSINLSRGPTIAGLLDNGLCDEQHLDCDHAYVFGHVFTNSDNLTCKFEEFHIQDDGSRISKDTHYEKGDFETLIEVVCPTPTRRRKRSVDDMNSAFVLAYTISVSNDGNVYEPGKDLFIYDSKCQRVENRSNQMYFTLKENFCFINGLCYTNNDTDPTNECSICDTRSNRKWSIVKDNSNCDVVAIEKTDESGDTDNHLWAIGVVGGIVCIGIVAVVVYTRRSTRKRERPSDNFDNVDPDSLNDQHGNTNELSNQQLELKPVYF